MAYISKINVGGTEYELRDRTIQGAMHLVGVTTTPLTNGSTTSPIKVDNKDYTPKNGDVVLSGSKEFVWSKPDGDEGEDEGNDGTGGKWIELGDEGSHVIKGTYTSSNNTTGITATFTGTSLSSKGSYTPTGNVSQPTFTGTAATINATGTVTAQSAPVVESDSADVTPISFSGSATPAGTISTPTFTGTAATLSVSTNSAVTAVADHTYTPAGTISTPTFTGTAHTHTITAATPASGETANYTPAGTISKPNVSVLINAPVSSFIKTVSFEEGSATSTQISTITNETLTLPGSVITAVAQPIFSSTTGNAVTSVTVDSASLSAAPTFTGTGVLIKAANTTAGGTVSKPTFTGTAATISHTLTKATITATGSYTPAGTVSKPTFTGTALTITTSKKLVASVAAASVTTSANYTPAGSVSKPSFTGTAATVTVTGTPAGSVSITDAGHTHTVTL